MKQVISITKAKHIGGLGIEITFSDSTQKSVNFSEFITTSLLPDLKKYAKLQNFKKFKIIAGNLVWGDYEMIFPIQDLYNGSIVKRQSNKPIKTA